MRKNIRRSLAALSWAMFCVSLAQEGAAKSIVVDDTDAGFSVLSGAAWRVADYPGEQWGVSCYSANTDQALSEVEWRPLLTESGPYEVAVWYVSLGDAGTNGAWYRIHHAGGVRSKYVDQRSNGSQWISLGTYDFVAGATGYVTLINQAEAAKTIFADAVLFKDLDEPPETAVATELLAPGVTHARWELSGPQVAHTVEFDLANPEYFIDMGFAYGRRNFPGLEPLSQIVARYDSSSYEVIAAINCAYFSFTEILGILADGVNLVNPTTPQYVQETYALQGSGEGWGGQHLPAATATVRFADDAEMDIDILNKSFVSGNLALYTPVWGPGTASSVQGVEVIVQNVNYPLRPDKEVVGEITSIQTGSQSLNNPIPPGGFVLTASGGDATELQAHASVGEQLTVKFDLWPDELNNARTICNGAGWVLRAGAPYQVSSPDRHPRTVIAWNGTKHWFVTIDGRQAGYSIGASQDEVSQFLLHTLNADHGILLDGGGSTTLVIHGEVANCPSDGASSPCTGDERAIPNALFLVRTVPHTVGLLSDDFPSGGRILDWDEKFSLNPVVSFSPAAPGGDGFVMQVANPGGGYETASAGQRGDRNYRVQAQVYCDYRPELQSDGFERVGIFARDDGNANFDSPERGGGNCYAMTFDSDSGRIRAAKIVEGEMTDFLQSFPLTLSSDAWRLFAIECNENRIRYLLDGVEIASVSDAAHVDGRAGVGNHEYFSTDANTQGTIVESFVLNADLTSGLSGMHWRAY